MKTPKRASPVREKDDPETAVAEAVLDDDLDTEQESDAESPEILLDAEDLDDIADLEADSDLSPGLLPESDLADRPVPVARQTSTDSLNLYIREISQFPLLKPEEEYALARKVLDENDPDAAFRLVSSHLRLVVKIAMDFQRRWMQNVLDLIQEGNVGLMRAVNKFDPEKGIKFSYYAAFWIKAYILKFIMDNWRMVKIGTTQAQRKLFYNLNKKRQKLIAQGYDPDAATLSKQLNVSEKQVVEMEQRMDGSDVSLDATINTDGNPGASRIELLPALGPGIEDVLADNQIAHLVREKLQTIAPLLSDKEAYILEHRLMKHEPGTLREIGEKYDITRERVRQIEARLLQKVRDHLFKEIKDFSQDWINEH